MSQDKLHYLQVLTNSEKKFNSPEAKECYEKIFFEILVDGVRVNSITLQNPEVREFFDRWLRRARKLRENETEFLRRLT